MIQATLKFFAGILLVVAGIAASLGTVLVGLFHIWFSIFGSEKAAVVGTFGSTIILILLGFAYLLARDSR